MFVLYKELSNYFITSHENYNSFVRNLNKVIKIEAENDTDAIEIAESNFPKNELIILIEKAR